MVAIESRYWLTLSDPCTTGTRDLNLLSTIVFKHSIVKKKSLTGQSARECTRGSSLKMISTRESSLTMPTRDSSLTRFVAYDECLSYK